MKVKTLTALMLLCILLIMQFNFVSFYNISYATEDKKGWHYKQLTENAQEIYNAMQNMYTKGMFKSMQDYDLVSNKHFTSSKIGQYVKGDYDLKSDFNAAKYAFYADNPEIFYVDFSKLTIRTTVSKDGSYHAYIGAGSSSNYYIGVFTTQKTVEKAIQEFDNRVNQIVNGAKNIKIDTDKNKQAEQIKYVHNELINSVSYRLLYECTQGNEELLSTPYGALVKKESVCEGYARSLKTILDRLGIECILVQGLHRSSSSRMVEHMWNYVKVVDGNKEKWFAVDATMDDPYDPDNLTTNNGKDGYEHSEYLLAGKTKMYGINEDGQESYYLLNRVDAAGGYYFEYPELEEDGFYVKAVVSHNGLDVKFFDKGKQENGVKLGNFHISYKGMGYEKSKEAGYGLVSKYYFYHPGDDKWEEGNWAYFEPHLYPSAMTDYDEYLDMSVSQCEKIEFAVTKGYKADQYGNFLGTEEDIIAKSEVFATGAGEYKAPPYISESEPPMTRPVTPATQFTNKPITHHVKVVYNDRLKLIDENVKPFIKLESTGPTAVANTKIENFSYENSDRSCVVTFDVTFSQMWADDDVDYWFQIKGLVGADSGKEPNAISYTVRRPLDCAKCMAAAKDWKTWGTPRLLANSDISTEGWKLENGKSMIGSNINWWDKLTLVTTNTTRAQEAEMENLLKGGLAGKKYQVSQTYNISLNMCKANVIQTGSKVRVCLGFPEGYGPESKGVTFKAYHYITNNKGTITGVEEIDCIVTEYGLLVVCDSFSPFAIVTLEGEEETSKQVLVSYDEGGMIELDEESKNAGDIITLEKGETKTVKVKADSNYEIETITVSGKAIDLTNKEEMAVEVTYDDVKNGNNIVAATYVAKSVVEKEEERGEEAIPVQEETPVISNISNNFEMGISADKTEVSKGEEFEVTLSIKDLQREIYALGGKIEFNKNVLEIVENGLTGVDPWKFSENDCNLENFKFVTDTGVAVSQASDVIKIKFKVKEDIEAKDTTISLKDITAGTGESTNGILHAGNSSLTIKISEPSVEPDTITSNVYLVNDENKTISKIPYKTTIKEFIENTTSNKELVFIDKDGNTITDENTELKDGIKVRVGETEFTLVVEKYIGTNGYNMNRDDNEITKIIASTTVKDFKANFETNMELIVKDAKGNTLADSAIVGTGMKLKAENLEFTLIVAGDIDGDGKIGINDIAIAKLHYIAKEVLTGIQLKAVDADLDNSITINDIAKMKLTYIGKDVEE